MEVINKEREGNNLKLEVRIEPDEVNKALEQAYRKVVKKVSIPGFRKGKVPRKILEAKYGDDVLHADALDILIPRAYSDAISELDFESIARPDIEDYHIAKDEYATFTATVEVAPEVELGQYTDLDIEMEEVEIEEDEIEQTLEKLQQQHAQLVVSDKKQVEEGDTVVIDFEGTKDGEQFEGGSAEEFNLEIGSGSFIPGFEEELIGEEVGTEIEFDITFPQDYNAEDLAGEEVTFKVKIKEIKEKSIPELNDEFARETGENDTLEELKEDIKENLQQNKKRQVENKFESELFAAIAENAKLDIPETMIENELENMLKNFSYSLSQQGMDLDSYFQYTGMEKEDWKEQNRERAYENVRNNLLLDAIVKEEEIKVEDEEIEDKVADIAEEKDQDVSEFIKQLEEMGQLDMVKQNIRMEKALEFLKEKNQND